MPASCFWLELDTTPPEVIILAPNYTVPSLGVEFIIQANERLAAYQEIYAVDSAGQRHDIICIHGDQSLHGVLNASEYPLGTTTIYARVKDEVFNLSALISMPLEIRESSPTVISNSECVRTIANNEEVASIIMSFDVARYITIADILRDLHMEEKARKVEAGEGELLPAG